MARHAAIEDPAPVGAIIPAGDPAPPTTTAKARAGLLYSLGPVLLGALLELLSQTGAIFPDSDPTVLRYVTAVLVLLGPVAAYFGVQRTPNLLKQPVQIVDADDAPAIRP